MEDLSRWPTLLIVLCSPLLAVRLAVFVVLMSKWRKHIGMQDTPPAMNDGGDFFHGRMAG